jgi:predicted amidohydrolase YtcJ
MTWTGPGFVDCHNHLTAVAAREEPYGHGMDIGAYHKQLQSHGLSPWDDTYTPAETRLEDAFLRAMIEIGAAGVVELHDPGVGSWEYIDALASLRQRAPLPVRMRLFVKSGIADASKMKQFGDASLELCGVKFYVDGWLGSRTCAVCEPFSDAPDNSGILFHTTEDLVRKMTPFAEHGWQLMAHAIGDRAIAQTLDAYERIYGSSRPPAKPRIEHAQVLSRELIARMAELDVQACIQPSFAVRDAASASAALGGRFTGAYDWQGLLRADVDVVTGSDYPIETQDPLAGLQHLVTGAGNGQVASRLDIEQALAIMTNPECGTVTLSANPYTTAADRIHTLSVLEANPALAVAHA